jgi:beta-mannosidase
MISVEEIRDLSAGWFFKEVLTTDKVPSQVSEGGWHAAAQIPSDVHQELITQGVIPDPLVGFNEHKVQWIADKEWLYRTKFAEPNNEGENLKLVFEGLDTFCTVYLVCIPTCIVG